MSTGYFLRKYDRTTCGGVIFPSQDKYKILGLPVARAGDSVTCGKDGKVYQIMGSVPKMTYKGIGLAGSIHSKSTCPCMAELLPSCVKAKYSTDHMVLSPSAMRASVFDLGTPQHAQAAHKPVKHQEEKSPSTCACDRDITMDEFKKIATGCTNETDLKNYLDLLNLWMPWNGITTCRTKSHFLSQICCETGNFSTMIEHGGDSKDYAPYYGRGIMQLTEYENYKAYGNYANQNFTDEANKTYNKISTLPYSFLSGFWYFCINTDCCSSAEKDDFNMITARINGGFNGYNIRRNKFNEISDLLNSNHLKLLEDNGNFNFASSEISKNRTYSLAWGVWHDPQKPHFTGVVKSKEQALLGYEKAKELWGSDSKRVHSHGTLYGIKLKEMLKSINYFIDALK
ncbi:PAAR domain-containing protein [Enterobacter ludwigii]|uniref:PAAR domain-containing protein n=1 Tax=Enterobacter ludwigii TaxID=299767 RepID=UPI003BEED428